MGSEVIAKCKCGLTTEILIGGNMRNFTTIDYFPFYCGNCSTVVQSNLIETPPICPTCSSDDIIPFTASKLIAKTWKNVFIKYFKDDITKGNYKCPRCEKMTLQFKHGNAFWD